VAIASLDGAPLAQSKRVLVQVGTVLRLSGWLTRPDSFESDEHGVVEAKRIVDTGRHPWRVANTHVTVTVRNPGLTRATLLDENGYRKAPVSVSRRAGVLTVELPENAMYVVLE